jgi:DNA-binding transcriptional ArsR family regulator
MRVQRSTPDQSALQNPLNRILGTETNVRVLRVLAGTNEALSAAELSRRTLLHISGIGKALTALEETGIVEYVGTGSRQPVRLRGVHPLTEAVRLLFRAERQRADAVFNGISQAVQAVMPPPQSAWIQGPITTATDKPHEPVVLGIITGPLAVENTTETIRRALAALERELDVTIDVRTRTLADIMTTPTGEHGLLKHAIPVLGPPPLSLLDRATPHEGIRSMRGPTTHAELDERSLRFASGIAERLRHDPAIVERARAYVSQRLSLASRGEALELREWEHILATMSLPKLRHFLQDSGPRATRLRQSSPFLGVLTSEERDQLIARPDTALVDHKNRVKVAASVSTRRRS